MTLGLSCKLKQSCDFVVASYRYLGDITHLGDQLVTSRADESAAPFNFYRVEENVLK